MLQSARPVRPTTPADLHRLAELAHDRGLRVFESPAGHWWCSSHSNPLRLHVVTGFSCDCVGFLNVGRCTHHSLLLEHLGWIPEVEDASPAMVKCPSCSWGKVEMWVSGHVAGCLPCDACGGSGMKPDHRLRDVPSFAPVAAAA